jgi:hypothetical protein
LPAQIPAAP